MGNKITFEIAGLEEQLKEALEYAYKRGTEDAAAQTVFWDAKELRRQTCMSWTFILDTFFHDPRFPKFKVRTKWLFPAAEARQFLTMWLKEQEEISK